MFRIFSLATFAFLFLIGAGPPDDAPAAFGAREGVLDIALSPSGDKIAFIAPGPGKATLLFTGSTAGGQAPRQTLSADGKPERLIECDWVSEKRLVCTVFFTVKTMVPGQPAGVTRVLAIDEDGRNLKLLSRRSTSDDEYAVLGGGEVIDWLPGTEGAVLMGRNYVPQSRIGSNLQDRREGYGVDRIDTLSLSARTVESPKPNATDFISDGRGNVRIMAVKDVAGATGYDSGRIAYYYRARDGGDWKPLATYNLLTEQGFFPIGVDPALDVAYGYRKGDGGRLTLYSLALDGTKQEKQVFAHPQVDVGRVVRLGRAQRIVGVTYATEKREAVYFDQPLAALGRSLSKALPGLPLIRFVDASADESKLLLWAGSDTDPGRYFLFDKATKRLNELMLARPDLEGVALATMRAITYKAADGTEVPAYLTLPAGGAGRNLPAIVMPHGGPDSRDEWGFDWLVQFFASRGFAVLQPNYRGSAGYGDAWYQRNGFQSWRTAIGDVNDAGRWLVAQGIADPGKLAIVGWSYGGYAALQANVLDPDLFKAAVAIAPVTDLAVHVEDSKYWTHHRIIRDMIGSGPHVREGSPAENAGRIKAPVLLFHGDMDLHVAVRQSRIMHDKLKDAGVRSDLIVYDDLDHQLDDNNARTDMLRRTDAFLRGALKIR
ncbi:MAG TPA: S9 family peptidase [Allosphingosinicella sp.]